MQSNFNKLKPQTGLLAFFIYFALAASVILVSRADKRQSTDV